MIMKPLARIHLEAKTTECICPRLDGCGGIANVDFTCPEHDPDFVLPDSVRFHSHPIQARARWSG